MHPPLILSALMDAVSHERFNRQRKHYFPAEKNHLDAHITLFHRLPGEKQAQIQAQLLALPTTWPLDAEITDLQFLGRGVAYTVYCPALVELRGNLATGWQSRLTRQDAGAFRPHITVQNKVDAATARSLFEELSRGFTKFRFGIVGLGLWRYLDGPWSLVERYPSCGS